MWQDQIKPGIFDNIGIHIVTKYTIREEDQGN